MKPVPAIVEDAGEQNIINCNAYEEQIDIADGNTDTLLWKQAEEVIAALAGGMSQRELARQWINARTGEPYARRHIQIVLQVVEAASKLATRPRFREAYNEIAHPGAHVGNATGQNEWYTPAEIIEAARLVMGGIDLDPASTAEANIVVKASRFYSADDDGLAHEWEGRVWMNPPYAQPLCEQFCEKLVESHRAGSVTEAIVLINNATETQWFQGLAAWSEAICFPLARVRFWHPQRPSATPLQGQAILFLAHHDVMRGVDRFAHFWGAFAAAGLIVRRFSP